MAWVCGGCGAGFGLRLSACPRCGTAEPMGRTAIVPKITAHGGPSDRNAAPGEPGWTEPDQDDDGGEGEDVSPGTSSSTSSETPDSSTSSGRASAQRPARTTGNRSNQGRAGRTTASGTDGSTRGTG